MREVFVLREVEGLSTLEVARVPRRLRGRRQDASVAWARHVAARCCWSGPARRRRRRSASTVPAATASWPRCSRGSPAASVSRVSQSVCHLSRLRVTLIMSGMPREEVEMRSSCGSCCLVDSSSRAFCRSGSAESAARHDASGGGHGQLARDGQAIFRFDTFGDEQLWTDVLRMHEVIPTVDPATALAVGLKVDVEALPAAVVAGAARRRRRSDGSSRHRRAAAPECRRRREGNRQRGRPADASRRDLRAVPLVGRRFVRAGHRQAARRLGQHRPERRRDRRALAGAGRGDEGRVQRVGTRQIRPAAPRVRRHEPHSAEQPVAADRDSADLRA